MVHKNSRGDKLLRRQRRQGCEVSTDTPTHPSQKGFCKYVITDEFGATRFAYEGLWLWAASRYAFVSGIDSRRGELEA